MSDVDDMITIDKWDGVVVKSVLDETAKRIIKQHFEYHEYHRLADVRLILCFFPIAAAFFGLYYDWMYPFPESATVLKICVSSYIFFTIILTLYSVSVVGNTIFIGYTCPSKRKQSPSKIKLMSKMKRFDDQYTLILEGPKSTTSLTKSVGNYFDVNGTFVQHKFEQDVLKLHKGTKNN